MFTRHFIPYIPDRPAFVSGLGSTYSIPLEISRAGYCTDIIEKYIKEGYMEDNELIIEYKSYKEELEQEKQQILATNIEIEIAQRMSEVEAEIRQDVIAKRDEKVKDIELEQKALDNLISREVVKLQKEIQEQSNEIEGE